MQYTNLSSLCFPLHQHNVCLLYCPGIFHYLMETICLSSLCMCEQERGQKVVPLIICPLTSLSPHNFCPHTPAHIDSKAIAIDLINYVVLFFSLQMMKEKVRSKLTVNSANIRSEVFTLCSESSLCCWVE